MNGSMETDGSKVQLAAGAWAWRASLRFAYSRASGPGGQAVNKLSTRAELRVAVADIHGLDEFAAARLRTLAGRRLTQDDDIVLTAQTSRSQLDNKNECVSRLRALVSEAVKRPRKRKKTKPTRGMIEKRLESKRRQSQKKSLRGRQRSADG